MAPIADWLSCYGRQYQNVRRVNDDETLTDRQTASRRTPSGVMNSQAGRGTGQCRWNRYAGYRGATEQAKRWH